MQPPESFITQVVGAMTRKCGKLDKDGCSIRNLRIYASCGYRPLLPLNYQPQAVKLCRNVSFWRLHTLDTVGTTANLPAAAVAWGQQQPPMKKEQIDAVPLVIDT